mgnify:CR=1 FL=1
MMGVGGGVVGIVVLYVMARLSWRGSVYPGVFLGEVAVYGQTKDNVIELVSEKSSKREIVVEYKEKSWTIPNEFFVYDFVELTNRAYRIGRRLELKDWIFLLMKGENNVVAESKIDYPALNAWLDKVAEEVESPGIVASVIKKDGKYFVQNGTNGTLIDKEVLVKSIEEATTRLVDTRVEVKLRRLERELNQEEVEFLQNRVNQLIKGSLVIEVGDNKVVMSGEKLISFLALEPNPSKLWDEVKVKNYLLTVAETYNRESQNARFEVIEGKVKEFAPGKDGVEVMVDDTLELVGAALEKIILDGSRQVVVAKVVYTPPLISTAQVNDLGISERIGRGESYYAHSIPGRVHNIGLTVSRITSALIPPGEEFSFNKTVGEISKATGYAPAYIIKNGRTELGDGGGVCQVSTTVFRAALAAGLPITERWPHAYRVAYYEQQSEPGIDATIFFPSKDLRFLNDTPGHILIQAINNPKTQHLVIEIYGTDDGRVAEISKVRVWGATPPPPDLYQDDPTLPQGKVKQVDWAAWGARTSFDYKVTRDGETIFEKTFNSSYRAWQNVYLRGTKN